MTKVRPLENFLKKRKLRTFLPLTFFRNSYLDINEVGINYIFLTKIKFSKRLPDIFTRNFWKKAR